MVFRFLQSDVRFLCFLSGFRIFAEWCSGFYCLLSGSNVCCPVPMSAIRFRFLMSGFDVFCLVPMSDVWFLWLMTDVWFWCLLSGSDVWWLKICKFANLYKYLIRRENVAEGGDNLAGQEVEDEPECDGDGESR